MDAEKARLARELQEQQTLAKTKVLAADIAEGTAEALRARLTQNQATSAAMLAASDAKDRNSAAAAVAERQRDMVRLNAVREAEAEKSILRAQLALVRSENASQNADRAQQRMRRRLAEQRVEEERQTTRRADRDSRRRRLDNAITFSAADTLATRGVTAYAERGQPDGGSVIVDMGHLAKT